MVDIGNTLKRAWQILWNYKVLWVFAFLLAISGGAGSSGGGGGGGSGYSGSLSGGDHSAPFFSGRGAPQWWRDAVEWGEQNVAPLFATEEKAMQTVIWIIVGIFLISIIVSLLLSLVRYPAETAIIRMVDEHETSGVKYKFKQGWKLGWNRRAFRLFMVDLLIGLPAALIMIGLVGGLAALGFGIYRQVEMGLFPGELIGVIFIAFFLLLFSLVMVAVGILRNYIVRYAAIDGADVKASFRSGWNLFKTNLKDTVLMALVLFGVSIAFGFVVIMAMFLLIPAYAILALPGAILAVIPGGLTYLITSLFSAEILPWIVAAVVGLPFFFAVVFSPLTLLGGLFSLFTHNVWTLVFRALRTPVFPVPPVQTETTDTPPALP